MERRSLESLIVKHFDFLQEEYAFVYDKSSNLYKRNDLKIQIEHMNGELNVLFIINKKTVFLPNMIGALLRKEFTYPIHFSSWVLSMGDVDSRLAYDAKLMKEYGEKLF